MVMKCSYTVKGTATVTETSNLKKQELIDALPEPRQCQKPSSFCLVTLLGLEKPLRSWVRKLNA